MEDLKQNKSENKLAVFENVSKGTKRARGFFGKSINEDSLSPSESDLLIIDEDDDAPVVKKATPLPLKMEPLSIKCRWNDCGNIFHDFNEFANHLQLHIQDKHNPSRGTFLCEWNECDYQSSSVDSLKRHVGFHSYHARLMNVGENIVERNKLPRCLQEYQFEIPSIESDYICEWADCTMNFLTIYEFFNHIDIHVKNCYAYCHEGDSYFCRWKYCSYKFKESGYLRNHIKTHTKEKVVACPTCGKLFQARAKFNDHRKRQLPIELQTYQCSQCLKLFPTEKLLRDHMRAHINHYKCSMCDMTCNRPSLLAIHIRHRHLNDRTFKCNLCDFACVTKANLEQHLITHCALKLLACDECDFRCRSMNGLDKHYQKEHGQGMQTYECHCCKKTFSRGSYLTKHLMKHHDYHWPSGHSRFRYKEDQDGIFRLQTVRYESLEVTEQILNKQNTPSIQLNKSYRYSLKKRDPDSKEKGPEYCLVIEEDSEGNNSETEDGSSKGNNVVITIQDVDEKGRVLKSQTIHSEEIICDENTPTDGSIVKIGPESVEFHNPVKDSE